MFLSRNKNVRNSMAQLNVAEKLIQVSFGEGFSDSI